MPLDIQFGLETEYGITRDNADDLDVVAESIALVRQAAAPSARGHWDYSLEDPHVDARGFRVDELRQDFDEAAYFEQDSGRKLSFSEIKSDYVLENGARFYNDHAHPEFCTPECSTLLELLQQDQLGDRMVERCRQVLSADTDNPVQIFKNNTDFQGHSYGCHENYLIPRQLPWEALATTVAGFLATRQVYAGAGKYGWEEEDRFERPGFQISQRGDFFSVFQSVDTMQRRPLVNTRDEPHADPSKYRRFHVIVGDANLSPYANYLKVGGTAVVLHAIARASAAELDALPRLADPVAALKLLSRDASWQWQLPEKGGAPTTAIEVQRRYLDFASRHCPSDDSEWTDLLQAWARILDDLAQDPLSTADRLDWSAKRRLLESFRESENLAEGDPWLRSLDLAYHSLDVESSLFQGLLAQGAFALPFPAEALHLRSFDPPATTRAAIRGGCIGKFRSEVTSAQWDHLRLRDGDRELELDFRNLFDPKAIAEATAILKRARAVADLRKLPFAREIRR